MMNGHNNFHCSLCNYNAPSHATFTEHQESKRHMKTLVKKELKRLHLELLGNCHGSTDSPVSPAPSSPPAEYIGSVIRYEVLGKQHSELVDDIESKLSAFLIEKDETIAENDTDPTASECSDGLIVLFYKYFNIEESDVGRVAAWQTLLAQVLGLTGRIRIAAEGINGTCSGTEVAVKLYMLRTSSLFGPDIDFKTSVGHRKSFKDLQVLAVKEIVTMGIDPNEVTSSSGGVHLSPIEFHKGLIECDKAASVIIDCRNGYESKVGHFSGAIKPETRTFSEWPDAVKQLLDDPSLALKEKTVYMYCTGGIRCERGSAYLKSKGVEKVFQLSGGIHRYMEQIPIEESLFKGKNFVFDERRLMGNDQEPGGVSGRDDDDVVGQCIGCRSPWDRYDEDLRCIKCRSLVLFCPTCLDNPRLVERRCERCIAGGLLQIISS